jgi:hypothetical protein
METGGRLVIMVLYKEEVVLGSPLLPYMDLEGAT